MSDKRSIGQLASDGEYMEAWRKFKDDHPEAYTAAAILPVTGQAAAVADYADAMDRSDSADGAMAAASLIPGVRLLKGGGRVASRVAPSILDLSIARVATPSSVRARIAPATERADKIGKAAAAEQAAEYAGGRTSKDDQVKHSKEYADAWRAEPPARAKGSPSD